MSIFKKIFSRDSISNDVLSNGGFCALKPELQERLSCGVNYNLKLVIRGERKTGKSSLLSRLKGETFVPNYTPTDEIKVACILWNYQPTNEVVKVDVWDVVDKGRQREFTHGNTPKGYVSTLKRKNQISTAVASLDSRFIDVYKGANCVILIFDITKALTFDYVRRELPRVPYSVPVLVIGNFRDAAAGKNEGQREVTESDARAFIRLANKARQAAFSAINPSNDLDISDLQNMYKCAPIRYCETSMQNGFGLMYIHSFLTIPFLHLQCSYLIQGLVANRQAFYDSIQHLDSAEENQEAICSYEKFTRWLEGTRGQVASGNPQVHQQMQTAIKSQDLKMSNESSTSNQCTGKTEAVSKLVVPSNPEEDKSFRDLLNTVEDDNNSPPCPVSNKHISTIENLDLCEPSSNPVPAVAAFQEDPDPDDAAENLAALYFGTNGSIISPPPVLRTTNSSIDDIDDDDDADLMNEDSDDDEEHLGPALGLISPSSPSTPSVVNRNEVFPPSLPQEKSQILTLLSPSTSSSSSSSRSSSRGNSLEIRSSPTGAAVFQKTSSILPSKEISDLATVDEKIAFERFLESV